MNETFVLKQVDILDERTKDLVFLISFKLIVLIML